MPVCPALASTLRNRFAQRVVADAVFRGVARALIDEERRLGASELAFGKWLQIAKLDANRSSTCRRMSGG